jgi:hypothetical protein
MMRHHQEQNRGQLLHLMSTLFCLAMRLLARALAATMAHHHSMSKANQQAQTEIQLDYLQQASVQQMGMLP